MSGKEKALKTNHSVETPRDVMLVIALSSYYKILRLKVLLLSQIMFP